MVLVVGFSWWLSAWVSLGDSCGGCFFVVIFFFLEKLLWLLLVVGMVVFLMVFGGSQGGGVVVVAGQCRDGFTWWWLGFFSKCRGWVYLVIVVVSFPSGDLVFFFNYFL